MTKKYDEFLIALESLCKAHGVIVEPSINETLHVWDVDADHPETSEYFHALFEDKTID